jgi:hypothetical protein
MTPRSLSSLVVLEFPTPRIKTYLGNAKFDMHQHISKWLIEKFFKKKF